MPSGFGAFESHVLADRDLQARLLDQPDRERFVSLVCAAADERGIELSAADVEEALAAARRRHRERWV